MIRRTLFPLALAALVGGTSVAHAQIFEVGLSDADAEALSQPARDAYDQALHHFDRVNTEAAIEDLAAAAAIDTNSTGLQFLLVRLASHRAETSYGEESLRYYDMAEAALRRLLANPDLDPSQRERVSRDSERIREGKETIRERDEQRMATGLELMRNVRNDRLVRTGIAAKAREIQSIDEALRVADPVEEEGLTLADVWPLIGAPGLAIDLEPPQQQQQFGMMGDPWGMYGGDPAMMWGQQPPMGPPARPQTDPFGQPQGDPFGQPQGDPFGQPQGDPFGQPQGANPFGQPQGNNPFGEPMGQPPDMMGGGTVFR